MKTNKSRVKQAPKSKKPETLVKLDLGCGMNVEEGFIGVDKVKGDKVKVMLDLASGKWPWKDNSVDEIKAHQFFQYLTGTQRVFVLNEMFRVLKPGAKATVQSTPWSHERAYADPRVQWPPLAASAFLPLNKEIRDKAFPYLNDLYKCNFTVVPGAGYPTEDTWLSCRNDDEKQVLMARNINTTTDIVMTLIKEGGGGTT
jgi:hypothetical protein